MLRESVKKWKSKRGESISEALVAMLVIVLAGMMLAGAIVASAHLNNSSEKVATFPQYAGTSVGSGRKASVSGSLAGSVTVNTDIPVTVYQDKGEMYYYVHE